MHASAARISANQQNSQFSTGPSTAAGKEKAKFNAVKHGACAKTLILPTEDVAAFEAFAEFLRKTWDPINDLAEKHLNELVECEWRIDRIRKAEFKLLALGIRENLGKFEDEEDPEMRKSLAEAATWRDYHKQFAQFHRHENALLKEKDRLEGILARFIQQRKTQAQQSIFEQAQRKLAAYEEIGRQIRSGFVPQRAPQTAATPSQANQASPSAPADEDETA